MLKKTTVSSLIMTAIFTMVLSLSAQSIGVSNGSAVFEGKQYPVYPEVKTVSTNKDIIYGRGINYLIPAKNLNEADQISQKVVKFYTGNKVAGIAIKEKFTSTKSKTEIFYISSNKGIEVMVVSMKTGVSVVLIPN